MRRSDAGRSSRRYKLQILAVEQERYGAAAQYPPDVLRAGRRPLLQFPLETLEATMANPRAIGIALRDRVSGRFVGYALGSALENHDEEGVSSDPHFGENNTFYLQAMATLPTVQNAVELENHLLDALRERAIAAGFEFLSTLIEERLRETGPRVAAQRGGAGADRQLPAQRHHLRLPAGAVARRQSVRVARPVRAVSTCRSRPTRRRERVARRRHVCRWCPPERR